MSSYNLKMILKSCVREQAYLPCNSPVRGCVCSVGSNGLLESLFRRSSNVSFSVGFFWSSFFDFLRKGFSSSSLFIVVVRRVKDRVNSFLGGITDYRVTFLLGFQYTTYESLTSFFPIGQIIRKCPQFMQSRLGEYRKHFFNTVYFVNCGIHSFSIPQKYFVALKVCRIRLRLPPPTHRALYLGSYGSPPARHSKRYTGTLSFIRVTYRPCSSITVTETF